MAQHPVARFSPQFAGLICAGCATSLGAVYLHLAGAPVQLLTVNIGALILGLVSLRLLTKAASIIRGRGEWAMLGGALMLLATSLFGVSAEGATRWVAAGSLIIQPSLILLPLMVISFTRTRTSVATGAILVAALSVAVQPDRAMAGLLVAGLAVQALLRRDRHLSIALGGSIAAFLVTAIRTDGLPAMPYVDRVYYEAFSISLVAGLAVIAGTILLLVPAMAGAWLDRSKRDLCLVFGAVWLAAIVAASLGNYPTPVVGYSGAAVFGYVLSLFALSNARSAAAGANYIQNGEVERSQANNSANNFVPIRA